MTANDRFTLSIYKVAGLKRTKEDSKGLARELKGITRDLKGVWQNDSKYDNMTA